MTHFLLIVFVILIAAIGASVGSFLNVVVWRVPEKMSLIAPPSHCPKCDKSIRWFDNIPILSWFILKGRCRDCGERISFRYPLVEFLSFLVALMVGWALLLGNWTGMKSQPFYWDDYVNWTLTYNDVLDVDFQQEKDARVSVREEGGSVNSTKIDLFSVLLRSTTILAIFWTLVVDLALTLGFVEWDKGSSPKSLVYTVLITLILALLTCCLINEFSSIRTICFKFITSAGMGALGGVVCSVFFPKEFRLELVTLGAVWGVVSGYILAFPGFLLISLVSMVVYKRSGRQACGLTSFLTMLVLLFIEITLGGNI